MVNDADYCAVGLSSNPGEDMDVCKCIVPSRHGDILNSRRTASPLVTLVTGDERLRPTTSVRLATCHDEFRRPRSDYDRQLLFTELYIDVIKLIKRFRVPKQLSMRGEIRFSDRSLEIQSPILRGSAFFEGSKNISICSGIGGGGFASLVASCQSAGIGSSGSRGCGRGQRRATHQPLHLAATGCTCDDRFLKKEANHRCETGRNSINIK
ncbi:hypothetical protein TNCV_2485341 [Trichonephila clavipes]|uniref:Uncharacterized protein n=1 Tax=Trichonephila clavipes TaxID=2585209 RepID=A0A8X7BC87_TRICX|nr:hypothetical protein TNCV_2485341 [Trichonephila clavipes]